MKSGVSKTRGIKECKIRGEVILKLKDLFELGDHSRIAVKIVDDRGIESLKVIDVILEKAQ